MKLDYDLIKEILEEVEAKDDMDPYTEEEDDYRGKEEEFEKLMYHYKILIDAGFVDGKIYNDIFTPSGGIQAIKFTYTALTLKGHEALEAMQNDNIWNKIKDGAVKMGVEGVKQIPALAIKAITGS